MKYLFSLSFSKVLTFACCFTSLFSPHFSMQVFSFSFVLSMYISTLTLPTYFYFLTVISPSLHFSIKSLFSLYFKAQKGRSWGDEHIYIYVIQISLLQYLCLNVLLTRQFPRPLRRCILFHHWPLHGGLPSLARKLRDLLGNVRCFVFFFCIFGKYLQKKNDPKIEKTQ